jgi:hypothetical protein
MPDTSKQIEKEAVFIIGRVFSVDGRTVKIKVNKNKNHSHIIYDGSTIKNVSVGSYVKILKGFTTIIGKIEGEYVEEEKYYNSLYKKDEKRVKRILQASLFGHYEGLKFRQGIKEMPLIDNECYILDKNEFNDLHQFANTGEPVVNIGVLTEEPSQIINISVNKLFASHIGIFGNTGSGKSNTLARIYTELFKLKNDFVGFTQKSKFVFIDFNGEYTNQNVLTPDKDVFNLSTGIRLADKYPISSDYIEDIEILSVLLEATEKTQKPFLNRAVNSGFFNSDGSYRQSLENTLKLILKRGDRATGIGIIKDLINELRPLSDGSLDAFDQMVDTKLTQHSTNGDYRYRGDTGTVYANEEMLKIYTDYFQSHVDSIAFRSGLLEKIQLKIILTYYHEIASGYSNQEHIKPLIGRMYKKFKSLDKVIRIADDEISSNVSVISLKDVNLEMKKVLPLVICKQLYDNQKNQPDKTSLHIVVDEAHNILSEASQRESETWKDYRLETFEEIIKEGRKFGTFLTIASQRPSDISSTIISQLHNYFIHRLININDINAIGKTVAYLDKLSFESIPILSIGSCFIAGLATDLPIKVDVGLLPQQKRPNSETINLSEQWNKG